MANLKRTLCRYIIEHDLFIKCSNFIVKKMEKCKKGSWLWWRLAKLHFKLFDLSCIIFRCATA